MRVLVRSAACGVFVAGLLAAAGCGRPAGQAAGKVTWKGAPVAGAELTFAPAAAAPDNEVSGTSGDDGTYYLNYVKNGGLPVGKYKVAVVRYTLRDGKPLPGGEEGAALLSDEGKVVKHTYEFEKEIVAGANAIDFELSEGRKSTD